MKTNLLIASLVLAFQVVLHAQRLTPSERVIKTAVDNCMAKVTNEKADDGFSILFRDYWNDKPTAPRAAMTMQREYREVLGRLEDRLGKAIPNGYEFIGVKRLGTCVIKLVYLQKNELSFLPWAFSFYRAAEDWRLTFISFPEVGGEDLKDFVVTNLANPMP